MICTMSGNPRDVGTPGEKLPSERPRSISGSSPPTDELDSEWDASPAPPAAEKRPSVRPTAVVVRTHPPPAPVPDGTPAVTTLLGVAPPPIVARLPKNDPLPRVEAPEAPAPEEAAEAAPAAPESSAAAEPVPARSEPPPSATEAQAPVASAAAEPAPEPEPEPPPASEKPVAKPVAARAPDVPAPDSVSAGSTERAIAEADDFPPARRSGRGLWIAAAAALVAAALWLGLRRSDAPAPAPESAAQPQAQAATPSPPQVAPGPPEPVAPAPAAPPPETTPTPAPEPGAGAAGTTTADGKKVVIVKVRPTTARFFHKGKKVGAPPLRVELAPGEKRSFEVGHPDFVTRKVVIDGSEPEVTVGLYPKGGYARKAPAADEAAP
jgi:hypothetical protein